MAAAALATVAAFFAGALVPVAFALTEVFFTAVAFAGAAFFAGAALAAGAFGAAAFFAGAVFGAAAFFAGAALAAVFFAAAGALAAAVFFAQTEKTEVSESQDDVDRYYSRFIEHEGQVYPVKRGIQTLIGG